MSPKKICSLALMCIVVSGKLFAQQSTELTDSSRETDQDRNATSVETEIEPAGNETTSFKSGYGDIADIGGPESVASELRRNDEIRTPLLEPRTVEEWIAPYYSWKRRLKADHGFSVGFSSSILYLGGSEGTNEDDAMGGIYRLFGRWGMFARGSGHEGSLHFRLENRSAVGSFIAPDKLGAEIGIAALNPGFGYSGTFGTDMSVFNWTQMFAGGRAGLVIGRLPFNAYLDNYILTSFTKTFHNRAFIVNPTIPTTGTGALGAVTEGFVSDRVRIGGGFFDATAVSGEFDIDTFQQHEFLKYVEAGWTPSFSRYKTDKIQLTYWDIDEQVDKGVPAGSGWALTASVLMDDIYLLFFRAGHSDGGGDAPAQDAISMGFDWRHRPNQIFSIGLGWAQPSVKTNGAKLNDEYVLEMSYGLRLTNRFQLLPELQIIKDPALNPTDDLVWVFGLRVRLVL